MRRRTRPTATKSKSSNREKARRLVASLEGEMPQFILVYVLWAITDAAEVLGLPIVNWPETRPGTPEYRAELQEVVRGYAKIFAGMGDWDIEDTKARQLSSGEQGEPSECQSKLASLRQRLERLDEEDDQIIRCSERYRIEREIYDLEHPVASADEWPEYIMVGGAR